MTSLTVNVVSLSLRSSCLLLAPCVCTLAQNTLGSGLELMATRCIYAVMTYPVSICEYTVCNLLPPLSTWTSYLLPSSVNNFPFPPVKSLPTITLSVPISSHPFSLSFFPPPLFSLSPSFPPAILPGPQFWHDSVLCSHDLERVDGCHRQRESHCCCAQVWHTHIHIYEWFTISLWNV